MKIEIVQKTTHDVSFDVAVELFINMLYDEATHMASDPFGHRGSLDRYIAVVEDENLDSLKVNVETYVDNIEFNTTGPQTLEEHLSEEHFASFTNDVKNQRNHDNLLSFAMKHFIHELKMNF